MPSRSISSKARKGAGLIKFTIDSERQLRLPRAPAAPSSLRLRDLPRLRMAGHCLDLLIESVVADGLILVQCHAQFV